VARGQAGRAIGRLLVAQPELSSPAMAQATMAAVVPPRATRLTTRLAPALAVRQAWPSEARPLAIRHDRAIDTLKGHATPRQMAQGPVAPLARPLSSVMSVAGLSSRVDAARLPPPAPIRPSPELVAARAARPGHDQNIAIAAAPGQPVAAPQDGRVVFADPFKSYGLLLIIEHNSEYHTLLWGFAKLRVEVGDEVRGGEIIGIMDVVDGVPPRLGVELRRRGRPVNPLPWLAGSSSKVRG
jgi:murein DD-endopeptidase MepM/ murein hydrolase activator NlpD